MTSCSIQRGCDVAIDLRSQVTVVVYASSDVQGMVKCFTCGCAIPFGGVTYSEANEVESRSYEAGIWSDAFNCKQCALRSGVNSASAQQVGNVFAIVLKHGN